MSQENCRTRKPAIDPSAAARQEVMDRVIGDWDANMRAIGCAIIGRTTRPDIWSLIYRTFLEQQGLGYDKGSEWTFLEAE